MTRITFIGAGSTVFAKNLLTDILSFPELSSSRIVLFDIDNERLRVSEQVARKLAETLKATAEIVSTTDARQALDGADFVINMIQVAGYKPGTVTDFEIPKKYGLRQTIADTLGIGGIMRALRTVPVLWEYCRLMEELCPNALFLNYTNPMAMNMMAILRNTRVKSVGLCHSVQGTAEQLATDIGVPIEEISYQCAGINHVAFYTRFERNGEDLYPLIRKVVEEGRVPEWNRVRYDMFMRLGYFPTESSEHLAEYLPHFIRRDRPELIEKYNIPLDEYIRRCEEQIAGWEKLREEMMQPDAELETGRSCEYGSLIIHSMVTGQPRVVYGNVLNTNFLINDLPESCCVEVPCLVDKMGIQPTSVGTISPQLAAIMRTNINVQELTVQALETGVRQHIYHAAMLDPHTAAELTLDEIWSLTDDLLEAHREWLPEAFY